MSGIVGIVNLDGAPVERTLLLQMTRYLAPRGPDAQEIWTDGNVGFGHALLRTTWESESERQPCSLDGQVWITADCRIDAREDLIRELNQHGTMLSKGPSKDAPDPYLILHAYAVWGEACLEHLLGDFSFAIWDGRRRSLFCARDHLGIKAFFYAHTGRTLIFSNMLNCVRLHPAVSNKLDEVAIGDFLLFGMPLDSGGSSFSAIRRLPPAHILKVSGGGPQVKRYWEFPVEEEIRYRRHSDYIERFLELFDVAVRDRLRTNKVGVFMSGGLDSPTIAATAHRILSASGSSFDLRAHTVVFDRIVPDEERKYSRIAADAIGIPIHYFPADDFGFPPPETEPDWQPPEPWLLFDRGRNPAIHREPVAASRVLLRGEGADPLLDGVPVYGLENLLRARQYGRIVREFLWLTWTRRQPARFGIRTVMRKSLGHGGEPKVSPPYPDWLVPEMEHKLNLKERWRAIMQPPDSAHRFRPPCELPDPMWAQIFESYDPGIMQLAAEARFPFADVRLVRYLLGLPIIPWCTEKSLLRVAMKGLLPTEILRRPKERLAGNPWALLLPPADGSWWEPYLVPAPGLEEFVNVKVAKATLEQAVRECQANNHYKGVDILRLSLYPISLNLWLRQTDDIKVCLIGNHLEDTR